MTAPDDFGLQLADWLRSESSAGVRPAVVEAALDSARTTGQRRGARAALTGPGAWPTRGPRRAVGRVPVGVRLVLLAAVLLAALAGAAYAGGVLLRATPVPIRYEGVFVPAGPAPDADGSSVIGLDDGRVLFVGGTARATSAPAGLTIWDPGDGTTVDAGLLAGHREQASLVKLADGRVLILGGDLGEPQATGDGIAWPWAVPTADIFDPATTSVTRVGSPLVSRWVFATVRLADGRVLITGGMPRTVGSGPPAIDKPLADAEIFDPATGAFTRIASMVHARAGHSMALLPDGSVLIAGGRLDATEIFDPTSATFREAGAPDNLDVGRLVRLPAGEVLLVDGYCSEIPRRPSTGKNPSGPFMHDQNEDPVPVHRFDPASRRFVPLPDLPHCTDTSTALPDGRVFVTGFWNEGQTWSGIYDPVTGSTQVTEAPAEGRYKSIVPLADGRVLKVSTTMELFR